MDNRLKEEMEHNIAMYKEKGPNPGDRFAKVQGVGLVVMQSKTLPSGLIIEPFENVRNEHGPE